MLLYFHRDRKDFSVRDREWPRTTASTFTQLLGSDTLSVQCCFTSTETVMTIRDGEGGGQYSVVLYPQRT